MELRKGRRNWIKVSKTKGKPIKPNGNHTIPDTNVNHELWFLLNSIQQSNPLNSSCQNAKNYFPTIRYAPTLDNAEWACQWECNVTQY